MVGEDEESTAENAFGNINVFKRMVIIVAGAFMNILLGFLIMLIIVSTSQSQFATNVVGRFDDNATSMQSGLMVGDEIIKVGRVNIHTGYELAYEIMNQGYAPIDLTVIRNEEKIILEDVIFSNFTQSGATFGSVDFASYGEAKTLGSVIKNTWFRSLSTVKMVWDSLLDLLRGRYGMDAVSGPVGITKELGDAAKSGIQNLLYLCAVISINLGVVNLLQIPALDGGRFVFLFYEAIFRKPIKKEIEAYIHFIGIILLLGLMVVIALKDVWSIFIK
jgi:regulator of sigma E protease